MKLIIEVTPSIKDNVIEHYQTSSNISCINQANSISETLVESLLEQQIHDFSEIAGAVEEKTEEINQSLEVGL